MSSPLCGVCGTDAVIFFSEEDHKSTRCPRCCGASADGHEFAYAPEERRHECSVCGEVMDPSEL